MAVMPWQNVFSSLLVSCLLGSASPSHAADSSTNGADWPATTETLQSFGAVGDGKADDTAALMRAFTAQQPICLDGENRNYRVEGTLSIKKSLCLKNATITQSAVPFDTTPYISGACPAIHSAFDTKDCGDPVFPDEKIPLLNKTLNIRTMLIRPDPGDPAIQVLMSRVKVDRGSHPEAGSRGDSAAIWLQNADHVELDHLEITGDGKGYGLLVLRSRNVKINSLNVHDMIWSPYAGDMPLIETRTQKEGWNSIPVREFRQAGKNGIVESKFYGVRVQEGITCAEIAESTDVVVNDARVSRCGAKFDTGFLPWQSDGFDVGSSSSNIVFNRPKIDNVWEGMDIIAGGTGVRNLVINEPPVSNVFSFGVKLGYDLRDVVVKNATISHAGYDGIIVYGPVKNVLIKDADLREMGYFERNGQRFVSWSGPTVGGIRLDKGMSGTNAADLYPSDVVIDGARVSNRDAPNIYDFSFINIGAANVSLRNSSASGYRHGISKGTFMP